MKKDKLRVKEWSHQQLKLKKRCRDLKFNFQSHGCRLRLKQVYITKQCGQGAPPVPRPSLLLWLQSSGRLTGCQNPMKVKSLLQETSSASGCLQTPAQSETLGEIPVSWGLVVSIVWQLKGGAPLSLLRISLFLPRQLQLGST